MTQLHWHQAAPQQTPGPFEVTTDDESADHMVIPPVVVDGNPFLGGKSLTRVERIVKATPCPKQAGTHH